MFLLSGDCSVGNELTAKSGRNHGFLCTFFFLLELQFDAVELYCITQRGVSVIHSNFIDINRLDKIIETQKTAPHTSSKINQLNPHASETV